MQQPVSNGSFNAIFLLSTVDQTLTVQLFDSATGEKYALFDMNNARGAFVTSLRQEVQNIVDCIKSICFETQDLKDDYIAWLASHFSAKPDFPWPDTPDYCVFRCPNQKWFALVMKVKYRQLGLTGEEKVWGVNMKAPAEDIPNLIDQKSIFPAWHMNKKHWNQINLYGSLTDHLIQKLINHSYASVVRKLPKRIREENPCLLTVE